MKTYFKLLSILLLALISTRVTSYASTCSTQKSFTADRNEIFGEPFLHLKEELERTFFRDDLISSWIKETTAKYPSILYMLVTDSDNRLIDFFFKAECKKSSAKIKNEFLKVNKLFLKEEVAMKSVDDLQMMTSRDKIVIEMDTYYFETGFGPVK